MSLKVNQEQDKKMKSNELVAKCEESAMKYCSPLARRLKNHTKMGLVIQSMYDLKNNCDSVPMVLYKSGLKKEPHGIVVNFCPFCGTELNVEIRKKRGVAA